MLLAAAPLVCTDGAEVRNVGNVRLSNVTIKGSVNCSMAQGQLLLPGGSLHCTVSVFLCARSLLWQATFGMALHA